MSCLSSTTSIITTAYALRRVFVIAVESGSTGSIRLASSRVRCRPRLTPRLDDRIIQGGRRASWLGRPYSTAPQTKTRDAHLSTKIIRLVGADGKLEPARSYVETMVNVDPDTQVLVQVGPGPSPGEAVCKVRALGDVQKAEAIQMERATRAKQRRGGKSTTTTGPGRTKVIEMSWSIDEHDLAHRLDQLQGFLDDRLRVEVVLSRKRRGPRRGLGPVTSDDHRRRLLRSITDRLKTINGVTEYQSREGDLSGRMKLFLQSTSSRSSES